MSFILNALRKSEQERVVKQDESLENKLQVPSIAPKTNISIAMFFLILINLVFLMYFVWSFVTEDEQIVEAKDEPVSIEKHEIISDLNTNKINKPEPISIAELVEKNQKPTKFAIRKKPVTELQQPKTIKAKPVEPLIKKQPKLVAKTVDTHKTSSLPPFLSELDYQFRRTVPNLDINVYVYAEHKQDRFIMIDMKKYQLGQQMDSGILLKDILMDSLVVEYNNKVFRIKRK